MSRGFLAGVGWGAVVAGVGLVVASQIADLTPIQPTQVPALVSVPEVAVAPVAPAITGTAPVLDSTALVDDAAPAMPQTSENAVAPVMTSPPAQPALLPALPSAIESTDIGVSPIVTVPDTRDVQPEAEPNMPSMPLVQTEVPVPDAPKAADSAPETPAMAGPAEVGLARTATDLPQVVASDFAPIAPANPVTLPDVNLEPQPADTPFVIDPNLNAVPPQAPAADQMVIEDQASARPAPGFPSAISGVTTGRLPSIGRAADLEPAMPLPEPNADGTINLPPIQQFARPFTNASAKPLFAILLQDTGGPDVDREALAAIPFPVSFVVDPTLPDAATAAAIYRAAGQEVVMLASGLPAGANASDLAISFEAMSATLPEAVAVMDLEQGGFQGNRTLATQVIAVIQDQGRGVISWDRGLNAASQVAQRDGVSNAAIFRPLDAGNESSPLIRRYLDRAAFKAAQDGRVVVAGHTRPETVTAVLEWAVEGRAATVAIAPVTAVMIKQ